MAILLTENAENIQICVLMIAAPGSFCYPFFMHASMSNSISMFTNDVPYEYMNIHTEIGAT